MREVNRQMAALEAYAAVDHDPRQYYGQQYGEPETNETLRVVRDEWLLPSLGLDRVVLEIGAGGGRWSLYFPTRTLLAYLVDGTPASEVAIRQFCDPWRLRFLVSPDGRLPTLADASIDYVFSYDTFVHFDWPLFDQYIREIGRVLKPGGVLHLHYARIWPETELVNAECFQYRCPYDVSAVLSAAGLVLTGRSLPVRSGYGSELVEARRA